MRSIALRTMDNQTPRNPSARDESEEELSDTEDVDDAEHSLLSNGRVVDHEENGKRSYEMTPQGKWRAYWLGLVVCIGGFLCMDGAT